MLKHFVIGCLCLGLLSSAAFAGCEDGDSMADEAAHKASQKFDKACKTTNISDPKPTATGEVYQIGLRCKTSTLTYKVTLREYEDAVCGVDSVELDRGTTDGYHGSALSCPPPGTYVNCMPPTTFSLCAPLTRLWVKNNCTDVHYVD